MAKAWKQQGENNEEIPCYTGVGVDLNIFLNKAWFYSSPLQRVADNETARFQQMYHLLFNYITAQTIYSIFKYILLFMNVAKYHWFSLIFSVSNNIYATLCRSWRSASASLPHYQFWTLFCSKLKTQSSFRFGLWARTRDCLGCNSGALQMLLYIHTYI